METFPIVTLPENTLREPSRELSPEEITTPEFQSYLDRLILTMLEANGVGIASPQIGRNIRAIVVNYAKQPLCYINPVIVKASEAMTKSEEGCLSVPGKFGVVLRHKRITVEALNRHGRRERLELKGFPAIVMQHEIDHLNGTLYVDKRLAS